MPLAATRPLSSITRREETSLNSVKRSRRATSAPALVVFAAVLLGVLAACQSATPSDPVARGQNLAAEFGCTGCHTVNGASAVGPTWKGLYGGQVKLADGRTVTADDAYLTSRLTDPGAMTVTGYSGGVMVSALRRGGTDLGKSENVQSIIAYIKTLK